MTCYINCSRSGLYYIPGASTRSCLRNSQISARLVHNDAYQQLSALWTPTRGINPTSEGNNDYVHSLLRRAGFIWQTYSGVFHMLPLGLRVQEKLERLIDKHMRELGASKLALSSLSHGAVWRRSGRFDDALGEVFTIQRGQNHAGFLLSPTHEEEITLLVAARVSSYRDLPLRLYQISRKYRDEPRARHGLLRAREFVMKDLYTFDQSPDLALETYHAVRESYSKIFDVLKLRYLVAEASSGNMGGTLSHEYHLPSSAGEDHVASCSRCDYQANVEVASALVDTVHGDVARPSDRDESADGMQASGPAPKEDAPSSNRLGMWSGVTADRKTLVNVFYPIDPSLDAPNRGVKIAMLKSLVPSLNAGLEDPINAWTAWSNPTRQSEATPSAVAAQIINVYDRRLLTDSTLADVLRASESCLAHKVPSDRLSQANITQMVKDPASGQPLDVLQIIDGERCPKCRQGHLEVHRAIELGHTFFLGTRYSRALQASVELGRPTKHGETRVPVQMGCYGIGVSRMIAAVAETLADSKGLNWPRVMAPFEVIVIASKGAEEDAKSVYDIIHNGPPQQESEDGGDRGGRRDRRPIRAVDIVLDDRGFSLIEKLVDAELMGIPVIVLLGRAWKLERKCEVQCRRLSETPTEVSLEALPGYVDSLLRQL